VGVIEIDLTSGFPLLLLPPPQADSARISANARNDANRLEILAVLVSRGMLTFVISFLSAIEHIVIPARS